MIRKVILLAAVVAMFSLAGYVEHNYSMHGTVVDENTVEDATGNFWEVDCIEYRDNTSVKIYFNDSCTTNTREDDIIKKIVVDK